jgi:hypothetical protein
LNSPRKADGQWAFHVALNGPAHRSRAKVFVEALFGQPVLGRFGQDDGQVALFGQALPAPL